MKTVLFVGAGRHQRRAIQQAKARKLRVAAVDRNPDAVGLQEADITRVVDFSDVEAVLKATAADTENLGSTIVLITHDMKLVADYATRVVAMHPIRFSEHPEDPVDLDRSGLVDSRCGICRRSGVSIAPRALREHAKRASRHI